MAEKILLVDDDSNILDGYRRSLGREFELDTAQGGQDALNLVAEKGPYAVVVSDMRMPGMDGVQLLTAFKSKWPDTVRVMLTGNADRDTAVHAINEGSIFRFLNKPCDKDAMGKTLTAALLQYRLVTAEKQLLEQTLSGSIQVLTEVLSMVNPAAFSRAERARRYIHHVVTLMKLGNPWQYEVAAMMSQLGCVTLSPETIEAVYSGKDLSPSDQAEFDAHPNIAYDLLSKIPRLEAIAWMIKNQNQPVSPAGPDRTQSSEIQRGAEMLRLILAYEKLVHNGSSRTEAVSKLSRQKDEIGKEFFDALITLDPNAEEGVVRKCRVEDLVPGMIVQQEVRTPHGELLVSKGQQITAPLLVKLKNSLARRAISGEVSISMPTTTLAFVQKASS